MYNTVDYSVIYPTNNGRIGEKSEIEEIAGG